MKLLEDYRDKIIFEVAGHDHLADVRTVKVDNSDDYYLNKVIFPGWTSATSNQPGFATFWYDTETSKATDLKLTFANLQDTIGKPETMPYTDLKWLNVDFDSQFGLKDFSGA